jgi:hypothetical protein
MKTAGQPLDAAYLEPDPDDSDSIVEKQGAILSQAAEEYLQTMKDENRYHRDVCSGDIEL